VIFIDTENTFRAERIFQIGEHKGIAQPESKENIRLQNIQHKPFGNDNNLRKSIEEYKAKRIA
jgi:RecA/RadA recombinase